jgi:hypothetical protein
MSVEHGPDRIETESLPPSRPDRFFTAEPVAMEEKARGLIHDALPNDEGGDTGRQV